MSETFEKCLAGWMAGAKASSESLPMILPKRSTHVSKQFLFNSTLLVKGKVVGFDVYSEEGRAQMNESYVWWFKSIGGDTIACYKDNTGEQKELSLQMCQQVWPNVHTRNIGENERILPNGVIIPIIPKKFYEYKKHNQKKSKMSRNKRKRNSEIVIDTAIVNYDKNVESQRVIDELAFIRQFFGVDMPTDNELKASIIFNPPQFFMSKKTSKMVKKRKVETFVQRASEIVNPNEIQLIQTRVNHLFNILKQARNEAIEVPEYAEKIKADPFGDISTIDDLPKHKHAKEMLSFFHYFFPHH